jgi:hypothetical protein
LAVSGGRRTVDHPGDDWSGGRWFQPDTDAVALRTIEVKQTPHAVIHPAFAGPICARSGKCVAKHDAIWVDFNDR